MPRPVRERPLLSRCDRPERKLIALLQNWWSAGLEIWQHSVQQVPRQDTDTVMRVGLKKAGTMATALLVVLFTSRVLIRPESCQLLYRGM